MYVNVNRDRVPVSYPDRIACRSTHLPGHPTATIRLGHYVLCSVYLRVTAGEPNLEVEGELLLRAEQFEVLFHFTRPCARFRLIQPMHFYVHRDVVVVPERVPKRDRSAEYKYVCIQVSNVYDQKGFCGYILQHEDLVVQ